MATLRLAIDARGAVSGASQYNSALDSVKRQSISVENALGGLGRVLKGVFAVASITTAIRSVTAAFMEQEKAANDLTAALSLTGDKAVKAMEHFNDFAGQMQRLTKYGDDEVISQIAYAKNLGVTINQLDDATVAATGLAARYRIDLATAMQLVGRASQGQTQMLSRYGIVLDDSLTSQEKFNELLKIGADSFRLAQAETKTLEGGLKQVKNALGDTLELFGGMLPKVDGSANVILNFNARLKEMNDEAAKFGATGLSLETAFKAASIPVAAIIDLAETLHGIIVGIASALLYIPELMLKAITSAINGIEYISEKLSDSWVGKKVGIGKIDIDTSELEAWSKGFEEEGRKLGEQAKYLTVQRTTLTEKVLKDMANPPAANTTAGLDIGKNIADETEKIVRLTEKQLEAQKKIKDAFQTLEFEKSLIGKTNDERERAIEMTKLQAEAEELYGKNSAEVTRILGDYEQKLVELQEARKLQKIADDIGMAFATTFEDMVLGAKSASEAMRALAQDVARLMMRQMVTQRIADFAGAAITAGVSSFMTPASAAANAGNISTAGISPNAGIGSVNATTGMGFADGGAFLHGRLIAMASGGLVDRPTIFPMANGNIGLMGEAGAEAVMPLMRTSDGKLGVKSDGGNSGGNVRIVNVIDPKSTISAMESSEGERVIMNIISKRSQSIKGMLN